MKSVFITVFSLFIFGAANAQESDIEKSELDGKTENRDPINKLWNRTSTIAIAPLQFTERGMGAGLSFEHALDARGMLSLSVPFMVAIHPSYKGRSPYYDQYRPDQNGQSTAMYYAMPGVKFYPTGMGKVKYALGPSLLAGYGNEYVHTRLYVYDPLRSTIIMDYKKVERMILGMMLNNSLNIHATPHLYMGAELGLGFTYLDMANDVNRGTHAVVQGNFKIGYTF